LRVRRAVVGSCQHAEVSQLYLRQQIRRPSRTTEKCTTADATEYSLRSFGGPQSILGSCTGKALCT
jgi:hypothetical protein